MNAEPTYRNESSTIGILPLTASQPSSKRAEICFFYGSVPAGLPLKGGTPLADFVADLEADAHMATHLAEARRNLADADSSGASFRDLRLSAGYSQTKLAARAGTQQSYIARLEAGTLDPGTDMLASLASALGVTAERVFSAVLVQRRRFA